MPELVVKPSTFFSQDLVGPSMGLNLTASPWSLKPDTLEVCCGRDVIHAGRVAPEGGRYPVGPTIIPGALGTITSAFECAFAGRVPMKYQGIYTTAGFTYSAANGTLQRNDLLPWPSTMVGGYLSASPVAIGPLWGELDRSRIDMREITSLSAGAVADDTMNFGPVPGITWVTQYTKFWIDYDIAVNRCGVIVSDGRRFYLIQNGAYTLIQDLGHNDYLGLRWRGTMIASDRMLLTSAGAPPRLYRFNWTLPGGVLDDKSYWSIAGVGTPKKSHDIELEYIGAPVSGNNPSWIMEQMTPNLGALSAGTYRVMVRAVNLTDGLYSRPVEAFKSSDFSANEITVLANDGINVYNLVRDETAKAPPWDGKWTHFEIWRTLAGGGTYYLEYRIPVVSAFNELANADSLAGNEGANALLAHQYNSGAAGAPTYALTCQTSDTDLARRPVLTATDLISGYRPPICQEAVNLQGVTICAGAAAPVRTYTSLCSFSYPIYVGACNYTTADRKLTYPGGGVEWPALDMGYDLEFYIYSCDEGLQYQGYYPVASRFSNSVIVLSAPGPGVNLTNVRGWLVRTYHYTSERVRHDEEIWYSRTDMWAPESFLLRTLTVSRNGDTFRGLKVINQYAAIIMSGGVHLLYLEPDGSSMALRVNTVSSAGDGTPWADSIVEWDHRVVWATPRGPVVLVTSPGEDSDGRRGKVMPLDENGAMRQWFEDAYRLGYSIDAGVDTLNGTIRFRRKISNDVFDGLQWSYRTGLWSQFEDDNGLFYVRSKWATAAGQLSDPPLYTVHSTGQLRQVNYTGTTPPYASLATVHDTLTAGYTINAGKTSITRAGYFHASLIRDVIRFRSSNSAVNNQRRVITVADGDHIEFTAVPGLATGDIFMIGAVVFRLRSPPILGSRPKNLKTIQNVWVTAYPGKRMPSQKEGKFSVRCYDDYSQTAQDSKEQEIEIFDSSDVAKTTRDRASTISGQGHALQIEIECTDCHTDFCLEQVAAEVREDQNAQVDASTGA